MKLYHNGCMQYLENKIKEYENQVFKKCKHKFVTERESGQYGELWDTCAVCGYFKRH